MCREASSPVLKNIRCDEQVENLLALALSGISCNAAGTLLY
jgi:hypothetical protein